ncbi:hypothetical protein MNBD_GAMMA08-1546 [hydrothermal vent metagenome]|uniref:Uncharacterized protein n=1 Tax=hydrothermal vent metagenome TaxID=652676 RepID=A0A3B0X634_9ZZZZ
MKKKLYDWLLDLPSKYLPALLLVGVIVVMVFGYGMWQFKRWFNYSWGYEDQVTSTVCEMVKPEYLKNPSRCK